jgi:hypothetical protein
MNRESAQHHILLPHYDSKEGEETTPNASFSKAIVHR